MGIVYCVAVIFVPPVKTGNNGGRCRKKANLEIIDFYDIGRCPCSMGK